MQSLTKSAWRILLAQVKEVMILILLAAVVISAALQEYIDAIVIFIIVVLNTILGFWQEYKAENAMAALKKMTVPNVRVLRDGKEQQISAKDLVPGDILLIESGNVVPADARLIKAVNLKVQEAALTGESESVDKHSHTLEGDNHALAAVVLIFVVAGLMYMQGVGWKMIFMTAISMAVAAIPEGLPAVVTIALALGAQQMLKKKALIRQLAAVETLGSVTVICSDKTGTLTQNKMTVTEVMLPDRRVTLAKAVAGHKEEIDLSLLLLTGTLCNDAVIDENARQGILGDPTECALVLAARQAGLVQTDLKTLLPRVRELSFDSERKRMSTVHVMPSSSGKTSPDFIFALSEQEGHTGHILLTKGAADGLIDVLQKHHEIVSMTGDGVNDAPALKSADIGVAMGITGTDVSKEASDMTEIKKLFLRNKKDFITA